MNLQDNRILSHIVAASENNVIGREGGLPWHLPDDFRFFKDTTWAMPVIMGRKTWESLKKELPGRVNIVITSQRDFQPEGVTVVHDIETAIRLATEADTREIFITGGGAVFEETMDLVSRIYLTRVHTTVDGDTFYPEIDKAVWEKVSSRNHTADEKHNYSFTFEVWERKS